MKENKDVMIKVNLNLINVALAITALLIDTSLIRKHQSITIFNQVQLHQI